MSNKHIWYKISIIKATFEEKLYSAKAYLYFELINYWML